MNGNFSDGHAAEPDHVPALVNQVLGLLDPQPGDPTVDATVGAGGHARALLERTAPDGKLLGIDLDRSTLSITRDNLQTFSSRTTLVHDSFDHLKQILNEHSFPKPRSILADLGLSSVALRDQSRGFSFQIADSPLDMRYDATNLRMNANDANKVRTAADILNQDREDQIARVIYEYGQERRSRAIARSIVKARLRHPFKTVGDLVTAIEQVSRRRGRIHPATRTFQALRIAVNDELGRLERFLPQAIAALDHGGRLAVISYHSLEDRIVKWFFKTQERAGEVSILTKHPATPSFAEVTTNPRSRSAKLRVVVRR